MSNIEEPQNEFLYCERPVLQESESSGMFLSAFNKTSKLWPAGSKIFWCFVDIVADPNANTPTQRDIVRNAWKNWAATGLNLQFEEVSNPRIAQIRISLYWDQRSYSLVGIDCLNPQYAPQGSHTTHFGWDLTRQKGTAEHEIGHALGLEHEHQSPTCPLVWNEQILIEEFKRTQKWDEATIRHNVINKAPSEGTRASTWDPYSIMEYPFKAHLIASPAPFNETGIAYTSSITETDAEFMRQIYPHPPMQPTIEESHNANHVASYVVEEVSTPCNYSFDLTIEDDGAYMIRTFDDCESYLLILEANGVVSIRAEDLSSKNQLVKSLEAGKYQVFWRIESSQSKKLTLEVWKVEEIAGYCRVRCSKNNMLDDSLPEGVSSAFNETQLLWAPGSTITWAFMPKKRHNSNDTPQQRQAVRTAWKTWIDTGINLKIVEVADPKSADVRISFDRNDGSWSWLGTQCLQHKYPEATMNLGWSLSGQPGTAEHEIGHTLGLGHEHQSPKSVIEWNVEAVYKEFRDSQGWTDEDIEFNVLDRASALGSTATEFDIDSIMIYEAEAFLIKGPAPYNRTGLKLTSKLSEKDIQFIRSLYPPTEALSHPENSEQVTLQPDLPVEVGKAYSVNIVVKEIDASLTDFQVSNAQSVIVVQNSKNDRVGGSGVVNADKGLQLYLEAGEYTVLWYITILQDTSKAPILTIRKLNNKRDK